MEQHEIVEYVTVTFGGVDVLVGDEGIGKGDTFFIYDPNRDFDLKHRWPFATIVTKDYGEFDSASNLNRPGVFRLNVGVSRATFSALFGDPEAAYDYAALDRLLPHPVYAPQSWVSVLNPSPETFNAVEPLLAEAYAQAVKRAPPR
jgi:hypothetical protein